MTGRAEKAAGRGALYRRTIAAHQAAGNDREALAEAVRWLRSEAAHVEKRRPRDAPVLYRQLTDRIVQLADAVPKFRPTTTAGREDR